eukprot:4510719-Pleurochrysis_carterae.AAC.3
MVALDLCLVHAVTAGRLVTFVKRRALASRLAPQCFCCGRQATKTGGVTREASCEWTVPKQDSASKNSAPVSFASIHHCNLIFYAHGAMPTMVEPTVKTPICQTFPYFQRRLRGPKKSSRKDCTRRETGRKTAVATGRRTAVATGRKAAKWELRCCGAAT